MREKLRALSELLFNDCYFEIMYFTLLIFSASLLSYCNSQNQVIYLIILSLHFLSLYLSNYIGEAEGIILSNIILIVLSICFHVFIPVVAAVALSMIASFALGRFSCAFVVEDGTVFIGEEASKEEEIYNILIKRSVRVAIKSLLLFIILFFFVLALYLNGFSFSTNIKLSIGYIVVIAIISYLCESDNIAFSLEDCLYDCFEFVKYFFN